MNLHFYKMQGAGNDYVYVDCFAQRVEDPAALSRRISDRHFGIGSDGLILLLPSDKADLRMQMFNADGSEGKMCGNGIRCLGRLARERGIAQGDNIRVETASGVKALRFEENGDVTVNMGAPELCAAKIPALFRTPRAVDEPFSVLGETFRVTCVSMGNPHAVVFTENVDTVRLEEIGSAIEHHEMFPEGVNTEFIEIIDENHLKMRVWERGSGETLCCGTGTCASVVAACLTGHCRQGDAVEVSVRGGQLTIRWDTEGTVWMTGGAELVFEGDIAV